MREDPSSDNVKFLLRVDGKDADQIVGYNYLVDTLNEQLQDEFESEGDPHWKFRKILDHQGPLKPGDEEWNGCSWNVLMDWEGYDATWEPLNLIAQDSFAECAAYAREHNLLKTPGWKRFAKVAKRKKILDRELNKAKVRQVRRSPKFKFGYEIPRDYADAVRLDTQNGNTKFQDAIGVELSQIDDYNTFEDKGKAIYEDGKVINGPDGYKKI